MQTFEYDFSVQAETKEEANKKMEALTILASKLKENELSKLAYIVKNDPIKTALAKRALGV